VRDSFRTSQFLSLIVPPPDTPNNEVCTAPLTPVTHTSELFTITDGLLAVAAVVALSITVLLVLFVPVVLLDTVLELDDTVLELDDTVLDEELTVLPTVVFVTVSVALKEVADRANARAARPVRRNMVI
tara:strand:+ start:79 stop:465 length:387 start_codon:yes stop_codon:yes gene_type:complete